jgi:hypothetical protein
LNIDKSIYRIKNVVNILFGIINKNFKEPAQKSQVAKQIIKNEFLGKECEND